ncbi:MAG: hypothetical protein VYB54_01840 [Pseudomonadota bacterium]|nr:hypothetical protein [Pseudomonadota bacterium]
MALNIETFRNADHRAGWRPGNNSGGLTLFKALGHPVSADLARAWRADLARAGRIAIYDPLGDAETVNAFYDLKGLRPVAHYVQQIEHVGRESFGLAAQPITRVDTGIDVLLVTAFDDGGTLVRQIRHLLHGQVRVVTLDPLRLPDRMISAPKRYVDALNFATNFGFFRDAEGLHTKIVTANYWAGYGATDAALYCRLIDSDGSTLAEWEEPLTTADAVVSIDSKDIRKRFGLGEFTGSLFLHAVRIRGHEIVKYALDVYGERAGDLSCTHDANAWPADLYAGMPAPDADERLILWVQNSHPIPIPAGAIGFNLMGGQDVTAFESRVEPFGTVAVDVGTMLPDARFPDQIEIQAGRYFVRPRYEVIRTGTNARRMAHANVERVDLKPDAEIRESAGLLGRGYIMPLPVLPVGEFHTVCLPTPMATTQDELPIRAELFDADGGLVARKVLGRIPRSTSLALDIDAWLKEAATALPSGTGHMEFVYDFSDGGEADGWLHALARIEQRGTGHRAETIFGAHIFNVPFVFRDEPQSYSGRPPGLTTRLFLRLGGTMADTMCHLIYPASMPWAPLSETDLKLISGDGREIATRRVQIRCGGSLYWRYSQMFDARERDAAGPDAYVQIRDTTCRLFGFHGLLIEGRSFSLDHMFGY